MPDFPIPLRRKDVEDAVREVVVTEVGLSPERVSYLDYILGIPISVAEYSGEVSIEALNTEVDVVNIEKDRPIELAGYMDMSNVTDQTLVVRWYIDGKLYREMTFVPDDFAVEKILYIHARRVGYKHRITVTVTQGTVSDTSPLVIPYHFEARARAQAKPSWFPLI